MIKIITITNIQLPPDYLDAQHIVSKAIVEKGIELYAISEIGVSLEEYFKNIIRDGE